MSVTYTYDPGAWVLFVNALRVTGLAEDSAIEATRDADAYTKYVGVDGEVTRSKSRNKSGSVKIKLAGSSAYNDIFSALASADELNDEGVVPIALKDLKGSSTAFAGQAWVKKIPGRTVGKEVGEVEWEFDCSVLNLFIGGSYSA